MQERFAGRGNILSEYALLISLVLVCSLGAIASLGGNLKALLEHLTGGSSGMTMVVADATLSSVKSSPVSTMPPSGLPPELQKAYSLLAPLEAGQQTVCFESDFCLNMPTIAGGKQAFTAGGLGSEQVYAMQDVLMQLTTQLKAKGADDGLVMAVEKLANSGHEIGEVLAYKESLMKTARQTCGDKCTSADFPEEMFWDFQVISPVTLISQFDADWTTLQTYLSQNPVAFSDFPEAKGIIETQYAEILKIAKGVEDGFQYDLNAPVKNVGDVTVEKKVEQYVNGDGETVTSTTYTSSDGFNLYQTIQTGDSVKSYKVEKETGLMLETKDPPPATGVITYNIPSVYTLNTAVGNKAEPIHQDANTICATGGGSGCFVVLPETASTP